MMKTESLSYQRPMLTVEQNCSLCAYNESGENSDSYTKGDKIYVFALFDFIW